MTNPHLNTAYSEWHAPYLRWRKEYGDRRAHADHIIPLARGGTDNVENLALACLPCNQSKHTFTAEEFARYRRSRFSQYRLKDELAMVARGLEFERRGYTGFRETAVVGAADSASLGEYLANARPLDNVSGWDKRA